MSIPHPARKIFTSVFLASMAFSLAPAVSHAAAAPNNDLSLLAESTSPVFPVSAQGEQRYIVQYKDDVDARVQSQSLEQDGLQVKDTFAHSKISVVMGTASEMDVLRQSENVEHVELDQPVSIAGATSIWGLDRVDQRTGRDGQYSVGLDGAGVNIYVVDSGLFPNHSQFEGRVISGWNGINDGRGTADCNGHGTHVAGTAAGTTYGVAKRATIVPIRALDCNGSGWSSTVIAGMDWAIAHHTDGVPAVMNMSIGGFTNQSLDYAVRKTIADGITVVASAGNSNTDACQSAPGSVTAAITVAATDINDYMASFSSWGSCVDIQAPGVSIRSAYNNSDTGYNTMSGTSMASPHVAGAAAVMMARNGYMTPAQVHQQIINDSTLNAIFGNRGGTANRLLFIPAAPPTAPSCSNLQLGSAWAGVGTHCKLGGQAMGEELSTSGSTSGSTAGSAASTDIPSDISVPVVAMPDPIADTIILDATDPAAASISSDVSSPDTEPTEFVDSRGSIQEETQLTTETVLVGDEKDLLYDSAHSATTSEEIVGEGISASVETTVNDNSYWNFYGITIGLSWIIMLLSWIVFLRKIRNI